MTKGKVVLLSVVAIAVMFAVMMTTFFLRAVAGI